MMVTQTLASKKEGGVRGRRQGAELRNTSTCINSVLTMRPSDPLLTFSLDTLCENGQVPSACLHVPRKNLQRPFRAASVSGSY